MGYLESAVIVSIILLTQYSKKIERLKMTNTNDHEEQLYRTRMDAYNTKKMNRRYAYIIGFLGFIGIPFTSGLSGVLIVIGLLIEVNNAHWSGKPIKQECDHKNK